MYDRFLNCIYYMFKFLWRVRNGYPCECFAFADLTHYSFGGFETENPSESRSIFPVKQHPTELHNWRFPMAVGTSISRFQDTAAKTWSERFT